MSGVRPSGDLSVFLTANTAPEHSPLVPELTLLLAREPLGIWQRASEAGHLEPYWAFAWPGGQILARTILDRRSLVAGRRVLEVGAGSGIAALAAVQAGARAVLAADVDPLAAAAIARNGALNGISVETTTRDVLDDVPPCDVVLIADVAYESALAVRVHRFVGAAKHRGALVLFADRAVSPAAERYDELSRAATTTVPALEPGYGEAACVWQA